MIGYAVRAEFRAVCFGMVMPSLTESACRWGEIPTRSLVINTQSLFIIQIIKSTVITQSLLWKNTFFYGNIRNILSKKKKALNDCKSMSSGLFLEATTGFEPVIKVLQKLYNHLKIL